MWLIPNWGYNMQLSQERAQSMKDYLVAQGADPSKLMTKGMGETDPIADNATEQGRFRNRRIEFVVYDETAMANDDVAISNGALDPDLDQLDRNNDDVLPDGDDASRGTALDPKASN